MSQNPWKLQISKVSLKNLKFFTIVRLDSHRKIVGYDCLHWMRYVLHLPNFSQTLCLTPVVAGQEGTWVWIQMSLWQWSLETWMQIRHESTSKEHIRKKQKRTNKKRTHDNYNMRQEWKHVQITSKLAPHFLNSQVA